MPFGHGFLLGFLLPPPGRSSEVSVCSTSSAALPFSRVVERGGSASSFACGWFFCGRSARLMLEPLAEEEGGSKGMRPLGLVRGSSSLASVKDGGSSSTFDSRRSRRSC
jgi:hypothetical protein